MGTRNLTKVIDREGVLRVAQYGQWDGYPEGQGLNALFYATTSQAQIERGLSRCEWMPESELEALLATMPEVNRWSSEEAERFENEWPNLTRNTGAHILASVAYGQGKISLVSAADFEGQFACEGVYTLNFRTREFVSEYGGVTLTYPLAALPLPYKYLADFRAESEKLVA